MKKYKYITALLVSSTIYAGGYKIPEVSTSGVALGAANIAHSSGIDTSYYNPANMIFLDSKNQGIETDLIYIGLDDVNYKGSVSGDTTNYDINAKKENFLIPAIHYISPKFKNTRVGLSLVVPGGLSKRWDSSPAKDKAKEFTLEVVELNPSVAFDLGNNMAFAFGLRMVQTSGIVESSSSISRSVEGDSIDFGYNLAFSYKPTEKLEFGATYRSNVDLSVTGNAKLYVGDGKVYDGGASVNVPLPAFLNLATSYRFDSDTIVEFVYERDFWSAYKNLDFNYISDVPLILRPYFDDSISKDWKDSNTFRLGITQEMQNMKLMGGFVYDNTPVPDKSLSFELPDTDSISMSMGIRYNYDANLDFGFSLLYSMRKTKTISNDDLDGEFSNSNVTIASIGMGYRF